MNPTPPFDQQNPGPPPPVDPATQAPVPLAPAPEPPPAVDPTTQAPVPPAPAPQPTMPPVEQPEPVLSTPAAVDAAPSPAEQAAADAWNRRPTLAAGASDPAVQELGVRLAHAGHPNSVSRGENAGSVVDESVMRAVDAFRAELDIQEDPSPFGGNNPTGIAAASRTIGPVTWKAIFEVEITEPTYEDEPKAGQ